jgi:hypothetical protein
LFFCFLAPNIDQAKFLCYYRRQLEILFMGQIQVFGKWSLEKGIWIKNPDEKEFGRSFAIANYDRIINDDGKINYIIFTHGSRVEDHSKNFFEIKEKKAGMKNIISHYQNSNGNYCIKLFLMDADAPIVEDAKLLAKYIEMLAAMPTTNSVNIIGLSKCSVMNFYLPRFFKTAATFDKTNIYNIAAPYDGTKLASPLIFYPEVKKVISSKISNERLANTIYQKIISFYEGISSNSHMDYDIAISGGIPESKQHVYDEMFIKNVFVDENVEAVKKLNSFKNFVTGIDSNTLKEAISTMNFTGIGLCILNDVFFEKKSDGMVYISSQQQVDDVVGIKSYKLVSAHHDVPNNTRAMNDVLSAVDDTIGEFNEKAKRLIKK